MNTIVTITTSGSVYTLPGTHYSTADLQTMFKAAVPEIVSMDATVTEDEDGNSLVTFRPKTGTKG